LVAISPEEHAALHPTSKDNLDKWQKAGIKAAPVWHASDEGFDWHKKHYEEKVKQKWDERVSRNCSFCGKIHQSKRKNLELNSFCHNNCKSAYRRKNNPDKKIVNCANCGKEYETLKYLPTKYCSAECRPAPNPIGYHSRKNKLP
jgi:endogenous inhibitor of DNA gyrase (YacG/DUF329 family)